MKYFSKHFRQSNLVTHDLNRIKIVQLNSPALVWDFIHTILDVREKGFEEFIIDLSSLKETSYFPNVLTPVSAVIENWKNESRYDFKLENAPKNIEHTNFISPKHSGLTSQYASILDKVWKFEAPEDVFKLVTEYMDVIYKADVFEGKNVLSWIEWCLNEVMDNVIQHASSEYGYVMGQIHPNTKHIAFCISDPGKGIYESLRTSEYWPKDSSDALTLALREGVTRDKQVGQGNGLWGLHEVVQKSSGKLTLSSSGSSIVVSAKGNAEVKRAPYLNSHLGGTIVDFQLDYSKPVSLTDILGGHSPSSVKIFRATDESGEMIHYRLSDQKSGFGTRKSGERIRNELTNLMGESGKTIGIDFSGIGIVSSSFADELVGKIYANMGPVRFNQSVGLVNMNDTVAVIVNKAMEQRLMHELTTNS